MSLIRLALLLCLSLPMACSREAPAVTAPAVADAAAATAAGGEPPDARVEADAGTGADAGDGDGDAASAPGMVYRDSYTREARPPGYREPDVIYVPTPQPVVDAMLELADVGRDDVLYDLGSGDGRIPVTAARRFGTRGVGIDIEPVRVREANANARAAGVTDLVTFRREDLFEADFSEATVVTLYLLPELNLRLRPILLEQLRPGTRIVSHAFDMGDWGPERVVRIDSSVIYMWTVPER